MNTSEGDQTEFNGCLEVWCNDKLILVYCVKYGFVLSCAHYTLYHQIEFGTIQALIGGLFTF